MSCRMWKALLTLGVVLALLGGRGLASDAPRQVRQGGVVQVGKDWVLPPGQEARGDVLVISGNATVGPEANLYGILTVISGNAVIQGRVHGDVNLIGGTVYLRSGSLVTGDVNVVSGDVVRDPNATVQGEITRSRVRWEGFSQAWGQWLLPSVAGTGPGWALWALLRWFLSVVRTFLVALAVAAVAAVLALLWPDEIARVARTAEDAWLPAFGVGLLTWLVGGLAVVLLLITLCLAVLGIVALFALFALALLGWTAVGKVVGERLWAGLGLDPSSPVWPTVAGTFLITLLSRAPCVGWIFAALVGSVALGAAVMTLYARYEQRRALPAE